MNYVDVYFSRVNHFGETTAERIKNSGIVAFEKWMAQSPFTVVNLSVERGFYFSGIIETSKDKEEKKIMYLYVSNDIPVVVGDILTWRQDNGVTEKWLLLQQIHKVHPQYQTFQIIKCNFELKWVDFDGYLRKSWAYAVSSVDSKVKSNFRTWHSLISPQPNKFAEIIMPRPVFKENSEDIDRLMRGVTFIIENEGWQVIECDWTSVEGILYISLTESKVNYEYDDRKVEIAELDRLIFPTLQSIYNVGDVIVPEFNEQTLNEWEIVLIEPEVPAGTEPIVVRNIDGKLEAARAGQVTIKMRLRNYDAEDPRKAVTKEFEITINEPNTDALYISGADSIRLDRYQTYCLMNKDTELAIAGNITYSLNAGDLKKPLAEISEIKIEQVNNHIMQVCVLHANAKNRLGDIILSAQYNGKIYTKTIKIVPLW